MWQSEQESSQENVKKKKKLQLICSFSGNVMSGQAQGIVGYSIAHTGLDSASVLGTFATKNKCANCKMNLGACVNKKKAQRILKKCSVS